MTLEKEINLVVELDGTGTPTGTAWLDGERYTFTASGLGLRVPPSSGKTSDKSYKTYRALMTGQVPQSKSATVVITPIDDFGATQATITCTHA
jgi:hypothetical protein